MTTDGYVDIHSHVLPDVDDGPDSWEESIEMLRMAAKAGTTLMVATPHGDRRGRWEDVDSLNTLCTKANQVLISEGLDLTLILGMENPLELHIDERLTQGSALTIGTSNYVLLEPPFQELPNYWEEVLFQLQLQGLQPIIAHPERQEQVQRNPMILKPAVGRGVLIQLTAGSIAGHFGPKVRKISETLLKNDLAHIIASDCHSAKGHRTPELRAGIVAAAKQVGKERAEEMASQIPMAIANAGNG